LKKPDYRGIIVLLIDIQSYRYKWVQ